MKKSLPSLISSNIQSAFLIGRDLADNVLLAQEIINDYGRKNISPRFAVKVNLMKAFDSLHWSFNFQVLRVLGYPKEFIAWIEAWLQVNFSISELYSGGVGSIELLSIVEITGLKIGTLPVRYLGIPLVTRSLNNGNCDSLVEKITKCIQSWASRCLSYAGRLRLIQFVLFSMQNFWCRIFLLPSKVVKKVNKLCSSFLWKGHEFSAKGVKVGWDKVCYPKVEGGLGLKNLSVWNKVCMMRCLYLILIKAGSLWMAWSEPYVLKGANIWQVQYLPKYS
ncbi:uncharacterized protein LOC108455289 [Gossypium arboreum]|uniref:uncharacterized protein LOC108455289 n=1 Tax=Gossypium arboreum TaxID=29729 RepID=UPI0008196BC1|nr:uncharacterized protein LOC108455289 [Gossypium arboreum]